MRETPEPTALSLFAGAGGLDAGLERAGFKTVAATDHDADCAATLRRNQEKGIPVPGRQGAFFLGGTRIVEADVREIGARDLLGDEVESGAVDLLAGGPPCQPFSSSGKQRSVLDPRGSLFQEFVRLADEIQPRLVLMENVRGLVTARGPSGEPGEALHQVRDAFEGIGYATLFAVLNAADFGCAQRRVRLFLFATKKLALPSFPGPTHAKEPSEDLFGAKLPWVSLREFLRGRPEPEEPEVVRPSAGLAELLRKIPEGSGLKSPGRAETTCPGGHWGYKQGTFIADLGLPARTVTAASTQDWVRDRKGNLRRLTLRECAALQGFPEEWEFTGSKASRFRQVGNAVPAVFGEVLGRALAAALAAPRPERLPESAHLPESMRAAIDSTRRDHERNKAARVRFREFAG